MTNTTPLFHVSLPITNGLAFLPTNSTPTGVSGIIATEYMHFHLDMSASKPVTTNGRSIKDLVQKWEKDPERAEALRGARRVMAQRIGAEEKFALAQLRLQKGLSQTKLGELMGGVAQPQIARIERGDDVKVSTIQKLAAALEVSEVEVFSAIAATRKARGLVE